MVTYLYIQIAAPYNNFMNSDKYILYDSISQYIYGGYSDHNIRYELENHSWISYLKYMTIAYLKSFEFLYIY